MKVEELSDYPPPGMEVRLIEHFVPLHGKRLLELGCGDGRLTLQLARAAHSVVAIEPDAAKIAVARRDAASQDISNVSFRVASAESFRFRDQRFDTAVFSWSL